VSRQPTSPASPQQLAALKEQINQQLRDSILDVQSATELVRVAQSNVELARKELEQTTDRFQAGVDDNLPVVQAQATLANAETTLVNTTSQHNQAKLGLARNLGIVDTPNTQLCARQLEFWLPSSSVTIPLRISK
jgi:outer membrane protein TolC